MSKYEIKFEKCSEAWGVLDKMKDILKEYGQVSVADQKELCGHNHTYTDNNYGWKELRNHFITYDAASKKYTLHLNQPEPLGKGCTDERVTENRYGYACPNCQSLNIREVSGYHEEGAAYGTIGYECTDCHTTFTVDVFDEAALKQENERLKQELEETKKELEEAQVLTAVLKKEIEYLKWEKTWYEANYTEAKKNINELQEKLDNTTRSYSCVANNLYKKKNQFKEAMRLLKNAEFYMNSGQDIHSMYPQWVKGYYSTVNNIKEFINKKED